MQYICIDLKSFYASVECVQRGMDPLNTNLVVADESRTEKTICLAVTPALKKYGVSGRARLFEVVQMVKRVNAARLLHAPQKEFRGESYLASELEKDASLALTYVVAPPRMAYYMKVSAKIYQIYLRYIAPEDIHVYSIDEVFIDATAYLKTYGCTARQLAEKMVRTVLKETGITATAGIGTNLYLAKIAMDIVAKKMPADKEGVRIAELLIDHAWGYEPTTMADIKAYQPENHSISQGQVLSCPYSWEKGKLIVREMTELLVLDLVRKGLLTDQMVLTIGYDQSGVPANFSGKLIRDRYGKKIPKQAHGSINLEKQTSSGRKIVAAVMHLYDKIVDPLLSIRRMYVVANRVIAESDAVEMPVQYSLFEDVVAKEQEAAQEKESREREYSLQKAMLSIQDKFGKNAILKGMNLQEGATTVQRNEQVGGHKA